MIVCRVCLAKNVSKDAYQLQFDVDGKSYADVMLFCLNIQVRAASFNLSCLVLDILQPAITVREAVFSPLE